jgi:thiamine-monophosphate kinase
LNLENYFISQFKNPHIGDDGAYIKGMVYSKDAFFEGIHFKKEWMNYFEIAQKAMLVNISDAIAMNAKVKYALLSVAMPKTMSKNDMEELARGFKEVSTKYGIEIIGGDTISNTKLDITITLISETDYPLLRTKVKNGYLLAYTGNLGNSAKELKKLFRGGKIHKYSKFKNIELRDKFIYKTQRYLQAGMDISDGLYSDLDKILKASGVGIKFLEHIPQYIGCSGEEYEMLVAFDPRNKKALLRYAKQTRTPLKIFAKAQRNRYFNRCKAHHF